MYRISELAKKVGLSRSTLLYYEKQGLLHGARQTNGYRLYSEDHLQQLRLLQQLQAGGLTLKECQSCLDNQVPRALLEKRLQRLEEDIAKKQQARELLAALLGKGSLRPWHQQTDRVAPDAHLAWLKQQGFNEQQALHLKWLSKDMNEHDQYMDDFMTVFQHLERWGPGSDADSLKALSILPSAPTNILDIGCGKGFSTRLLAQHTPAHITAIDNEQSALDELNQKLVEQKLEERVTLQCASMTALPFAPASFDCIWSEAAAYIMGFEQALTEWQTLLTHGGYMVLSDLVWLTPRPSQKAEAFWEAGYPDMQTIEKRLELIRLAGFDVMAHFTLSEQAWHDYYQPLKVRVKEVKTSLPNATAIADMEQEIAIYEGYLGEFGYHMFLLQKKSP
ncbi:MULTISPECIES: MerR family transcriptional regulator [unclassified Vibrio]|uniref:MerR family transcriptional regulator n=1 Tax=Vibrio sp. HB236076 TaxID=3232307 RepID=A0AB39HF75_9VIBR|nr:MerR family transcriptional regulator [Vibrio sp. HB161653]MDP5255282.1 MerR family transcriptional regulator [Vibrio sp. HB161653]